MNDNDFTSPKEGLKKEDIQDIKVDLMILLCKEREFFKYLIQKIASNNQPD